MTEEGYTAILSASVVATDAKTGGRFLFKIIGLKIGLLLFCDGLFAYWYSGFLTGGNGGGIPKIESFRLPLKLI